MVNASAGFDPLCTEQVNKIYVYFLKLPRRPRRLSSRLCLAVAVAAPQVVYRVGSGALIVLSSSLILLTQEMGSN